MSPRTRGRWSAPLAAITVALLGTLLVGAPAHAAPSGTLDAQDGPVLNLTVVRDEVGLPQPADRTDPPQISWGLEGDPDGGTAEDVVVGIDVSGISSFTDVGGMDCPDDVCSWPAKDIAPDGFAGGILDMNAKPSAPLGTTGTARLYATSSNASVGGTTVKVTVGAVGLILNRIPGTDTAEPGTSLDAPITIANTGSLTAQGVDLRLAATPGLGFAQRFSNCTYGTTDGIPAASGQTLDQAVCHISTAVEPGKRYRLSTPVGLDVRKTALFEFLDYRAKPMAATVPTTENSGSGPVLALVPDGSAPPATSGTDHALWAINAANTADIAVTGDNAAAEPGDAVTLTAKVRNNGPASFNLLTSDDQLGLLVDIPKGTTAVKVPERCRPWTGGGMGEPGLGAPQYICAIGSPFNVGQVATLPFTVKIDKDAPTGATGTTGEVRAMSVHGGELAYDSDKADNTARLTVHVKGAAGTGGSAGSGGNQPQPQTTALPQDTTDTTGALAETGSSGMLTFAWASAAALVAGAMLIATVRRRRARSTAGPLT
ncbi:LPXTG cell wall anchor domain-containing protein [Streptomyces xantholiticus]|uniref:LPXTG cell wall anchor domain-containing protein n=1 Tax=Streptomyces xantholiticus TaxID=68285 RepID=A0ABV1UVW6_9ACTN